VKETSAQRPLLSFPRRREPIVDEEWRPKRLIFLNSPWIPAFAGMTNGGVFDTDIVVQRCPKYKSSSIVAFLGSGGAATPQTG
jgi:hypothetical protein